MCVYIVRAFSIVLKPLQTWRHLFMWPGKFGRFWKKKLVVFFSSATCIYMFCAFYGSVHSVDLHKAFWQFLEHNRTVLHRSSKNIRCAFYKNTAFDKSAVRFRNSQNV